MCGIFGVFGRPLGDAALGAATSALRHRGPDGADTLRLADDMALGHTRLAIIDLDARADQPMTGLDGRLAIVFNGEIYNAPALRREIPDYPWTTDHSDTETILAAYWRWGDAFVQRLRGMFAFALWDARAGRLLLAVDRFSIKPLYLHRENGALAFASTAAALAETGIALEPNPRAVHSWLADGILDTGPATFFAGITQLPAATLAQWRDGKLSAETYWTPPAAEPREVSLDTIEGWLDDALASHLLSDVPVGLNLSSGLDSNLLRLRARELGTPLHGFTFAFPGTPYDEAARVEPALDAADDWTVTPITPEALWRDLPAATRSLETPLGGVAIYGHYRNARAAGEAGYKVLLAGEGSDETFAGYKYYAEAAVADLWRRGREDEAQSLFDGFAARDPAAWRGSPARLAQALAAPDAGDLKAPDGTSLASGFLTEAFARTAKLPPPPRPDGDPVRAAMWRDLAYLKLPKLLRWQDRCYMAHGVEIRVPFLDHPLVENLARVPVAALLADGHNKAPLRRLAERMLPSDYFAQPKLYVATPQREWLKRELRAEVEALLDPGCALARRGYIDLDALRGAYRAYADDAELGNSFFIWKFVALEALFQAFFEERAAPAKRMRA